MGPVRIRLLMAHARIRALALAATLAALALPGCGNTLQDQPIPHNALETFVLAPYPVYWLGASFHGMQITEASTDPSGSFTVVYGNCLEGGQNTCVAPLQVITSPDNSFVPGEGAGARVQTSLRGVGAFVSDGGRAIAIPTGPVRAQRLRAHAGARARRGAHGRDDQSAGRAGRTAGGAAVQHRLQHASAAGSDPAADPPAVSYAGD